jgi:ribonuclease P protein component
VKRANRLSRSRDFDAVYRQGRSVSSRFLVLYWFPHEDPAAPRFGFSVPKSVGGAVERNRIKRRLREAVRLRRALLKGGVDVVINPKKSVLTLEFSVLLEEVGRALDVIANRLMEKQR